MVVSSPFRENIAALLLTLTAPEQIEKMQLGFYLPFLLDHRGLQVAYPVQESTTWPRLACFVKRVSDSGEITDAAATLLGVILMVPKRDVVVIALPNALCPVCTARDVSSVTRPCSETIAAASCLLLTCSHVKYHTHVTFWQEPS